MLTSAAVSPRLVQIAVLFTDEFLHWGIFIIIARIITILVWDFKGAGIKSGMEGGDLAKAS